MQRHGFMVGGWFFDERQNADVASVEARLGDVRIGVTQRLFDRPDVRRRHQQAGTRSGFELLCTVPEPLRGASGARVHVFAQYPDRAQTLVHSVAIRFAATDYRGGGHGYLLTDDFTAVLHRPNLYMSGPPSPLADASCVELILRSIDPGGSVLDVGCGIGAYGAELRRRGVAWHGVEVVPEFCARMAEAGLPHTLAAPGPLPFADGSFDSAIAIEVLEHIDDYGAFIAEIARVVRGTACFSVPNAETIPVLSHMHLTPWHMLESDHKNFFSRHSLAATLRRSFRDVEIITYGNLPRARSYEGVPLPNHLFAVARN